MLAIRPPKSPLQEACERLWYGPPRLPDQLGIEWRFTVVRWLGIAILLPGLMALPLSNTQRLYAYSLVLVAAAYNLSIQLFIPRQPSFLTIGYMTALGDVALNLGMLLILGGGFDSPYSYFLFAVTVAVVMRYGYGPALAVTFLFVAVDAGQELLEAKPLGTAFMFRGLFLGLTVMLAGYLAEQARRAKAGLRRANQELRQQAHNLEHQALHDALTGLPNRVLFQDRLNQAIRAALRERRGVGVLFVDLDRFKDVNDAFGHQYGDLLLREIGPRLEAVVRESDTVARLGGDEFAVLLTGLAPGPDAARIARKILRALERPFLIEDQSLDVGASIGVAVFPDHGGDSVTLMRRADAAMYVAKRNREGFSISTGEQDEQLVQRLTLMSDLRQAIDHDELVLHYQPQIDFQTGRLLAVEALVRWQHPRHGMLMPDRFIPLAEQSELIRPLTQWVLNEALRQHQAWRERGFTTTISVNFSMRNLHDLQLPETLDKLFKSWRAEPAWLRAEITESAIMADPERAMEVVTRLHHMGMPLSIDDFGTGYSSLAYLKRLPADELKIDKSFVLNMVADDDDATIVRSTIELAHNLGRGVVAEGVDSQATWDRLAQLGCDTAQGYFLSRPVPAVNLLEWLQARQARQAQEPVLV